MQDICPELRWPSCMLLFTTCFSSWSDVALKLHQDSDELCSCLLKFGDEVVLRCSNNEWSGKETKRAVFCEKFCSCILFFILVKVWVEIASQTFTPRRLSSFVLFCACEQLFWTDFLLGIMHFYAITWWGQNAIDSTEKCATDSNFSVICEFL